MEEAIEIAGQIGRFPLIIRPAFTLGGTGGGISYNMEEFKEQVKAGIDASMTDQVLVVGADAQVVVALDHAVQRFQLPRHQLEEGGLACAVGADNRDAAVQIDAQVNIPREGSRCRKG